MCHRRSWPLYAVRGGLGEVRQRYVETWPLAGLRHRRQPPTIRRRCLPCIYLLCVALRRATTPSPEAFRATRIWRDGVLRPVPMHRGRRPGSADGVTLSDGEGQGERASPPLCAVGARCNVTVDAAQNWDLCARWEAVVCHRSFCWRVRRPWPAGGAVARAWGGGRQGGGGAGWRAGGKPMFRRCAQGSGRLGAGVAVVPGDGYCIALGERRAGGECLVELARVQPLADLCYQVGLYLPEQRPRRQADPPA